MNEVRGHPLLNSAGIAQPPTSLILPFFSFLASATAPSPSCPSSWLPQPPLSAPSPSFLSSWLPFSSPSPSFPLFARARGSFWATPLGFSGLLDSKQVHKRSFSCCKRSACPRRSAICRACSSCFVSISWRQWRNWSSMGGFAGLLDMAVSSDDPVGCSRTTKASEIGRSHGSGCTQALVYHL